MEWPWEVQVAGALFLVGMAVTVAVYWIQGLRRERALKPYRCARCGDLPPMLGELRTEYGVIPAMLLDYSVTPPATGQREYRCRHCFFHYIRRRMDKGMTPAELGTAGEINSALAELLTENPKLLTAVTGQAAADQKPSSATPG